MALINSNSTINDLFEKGLLWKEGINDATYILSPKGSLQFGIKEIDSCLPCGGLSFGALHEFALDDGLSNKQNYYWHPPLVLVSAILANNKILQTNKIIAWVGERCWANPKLLVDFLPIKQIPNFIYFSPSDAEKRFSTIEKLLFSKLAFVVIADGSKLSTLISKRLSSAARKSGGICLILRPSWEIEQISTSHSKWILVPVFSRSIYMRWKLRLLKCKGGLQEKNSIYPKTWLIEWSNKDEKNTICIAS